MTEKSESLKQLYKEVVIDHSKSPRNKGVLDSPTHTTRGHNPLCGDEITVFLNFRNDVVEELKYEGHGCTISQASISMLSSLVKGKTLTELNKMHANFKVMLTIDKSEDKQACDSDLNELGDMRALEGVSQFPARIKCAALSWNTLFEAINAENTNSSD